MKSIEEIMNDLDEDRPQDVHDVETKDPLYEPDEEDLESLLADCYTLLSELQEARLNKGLASQVTSLKNRLHEVMAWYVFH